MKDIPSTVTTAELAKLTGYGTEKLGHLRRKGAIKTVRHGRWDLADTIQKLLDFGAGDTDQKIKAKRLEKLEEEVTRLKIENDVRRGELVEREGVYEDVHRVVGATKSGLRLMEAALPPQVEGLVAAQIQRKLQAAFDDFLTGLSDVTSPLYQPQAPADVPDVAAPKPKPRRGSAGVAVPAGAA